MDIQRNTGPIKDVLWIFLLVNLIFESVNCYNKETSNGNETENEETKLTDSLDFKITIATLCALLLLLAIALLILRKCKRSKPSKPSNQNGYKTKRTKWSVMLDRRPLPKLPPESKIDEENMTLRSKKNEKKRLRKISKAKDLQIETFDTPRKSYDIKNANSPESKDIKTVENAVIEVHDGIGVIEEIETYDYAPPPIENRLSIDNSTIEESSNISDQPIEQLSNSSDRDIEARSNTSGYYETTIHGYARNGPDYASSYEDLITTSASENIGNYEPERGSNPGNHGTRQPYELNYYEEPDNTYNELAKTVYDSSHYEDLGNITRVDEKKDTETFSIEVYQTLNEVSFDNHDGEDYDDNKGYEVPVESISMESISTDLK
ncbi:uncharacterized protein [Clytia hemisphaerica]|uniref:Cnidarian restricted protein n=1 Tax=Clytia hemisphaerica TaxID=252671 RepID=A0A7M6DRM3_9CNID